MSIIEFTAAICNRLGRSREILDREEKSLYLKRHYLFSTRFLERIIPSWSFSLVLHRTYRSDEDGLHDHPWKWWGSRILRGGYWEATSEGRFWRDRKQGWRWRTGDDFHRLELDPDYAESQGESRETWSLFLMGPRTKEWGFLDKNGTWVYWEEYIRNRGKYV